MTDKLLNRFAVAMIVRNEAETIRDSLASIAPIVDQIVVYDTSEDDETQRAAAEFETTWIRGEWSDDFAAARNTCCTHVDADWVLWLDAGETIDFEDAENLKAFVSNQADSNTAYMLLVTSPAPRDGIDGEQNGQFRLVPRRDDLAFQGRVRESLTDSILGAKMNLEGLPFRIQRGDRENDPERRESRAKRNLRIADIQIAADGPTARMANCRASAYQDLGDSEQAVKAYATAVDIAAAGSSDMLEGYYGLLSVLDCIAESEEQQLQFCLKAIEVFPLDSQLLCAMGSYLQRQERLDLASRSYETAFRFGQVNPEVSHVGRIQEICAICFGLSLQAQGDDLKSLDAFESAVEQQPESETLKRHLLNAYIRQAMRDEAVALAKRLDVSEHREALTSAVRGACLASQENWLPANAYLKTAFDAGCRDALCLRWYSVALLRQARIDEAKDVLAQWQAADPNDAELRSYMAMIEPQEVPTDTSETLEASPPAVLPPGARLDSRTRVRPHLNRVGLGIPSPPVSNG